MMRRLVTVVVAFFSLTELFICVLTFGILVCVCTEAAHGDITYFGFLTGPNGGVDISSGGFFETGESINLPPVISGSFTNEAELAVSEDWDLRIRTATHFEGDPGIFGLQEATAAISVSRLGNIAHASQPIPGSLVLTGFLNGQIQLDQGTNHFHDGFAEFVGGTRQDLLLSPGTYEFENAPLSVTVPVNPTTGDYEVSYSLTIQLFSRLGNNFSNFFGTLDVTGIFLPNGNTPESEGYTLTFDDGALSPNVPEPSSGAILSLIGLCGIGYGARRRIE